MRFVVALLAGAVLAIGGQDGTPAGAAKDFDALAKRAGEVRTSGKITEAIPLYQQALRLKPDWDEGAWYLGTLYYSSNNPHEGRAAFGKVLERYPKNGAAWAFAGLCDFETHQYDSALTDFQNARSYGVGDNEELVSLTRYNLGILYNRAGRFDDARVELALLVQHGHSERDLKLALGMNALLMQKLPQELPSAKVDVAMLAGEAAYISAGNHRHEATQMFQQLVSKFPKEPNVNYAYGAFILTDRPDEAVTAFRHEIAVSPEHIPARLQLVSEYLRRGDAESAAPLAHEAVELAPNWFLTHQMLARILLLSSDVDGAIHELQTALAMRPADAQTHFQLARAFRMAGRTADASREEAIFLQLKNEADTAAK